VMVWIDLNTAELMLLHWTQGFATIFENPPGGFLKMLPQKERQGFLAWLHAEGREGFEPTRQIMLELPRQDGQQRRGSQRQRFTCTMFQGAEDLFASPSPQGARIVRLDLHVVHRPQRRQPSDVLTRFRNQTRRQTIQLWVEVTSKRILKSRHAPRAMF